MPFWTDTYSRSRGSDPLPVHGYPSVCSQTTWYVQLYYSALFRSRFLGCHATRGLLEEGLRDVQVNASAEYTKLRYQQTLSTLCHFLPDPVLMRQDKSQNVFPDATVRTNLRINFPPKTEF